MDHDSKTAINALEARLELDVLRLHLKIRRHSKALEVRVDVLEKQIAEIAGDGSNGGAK